jgi:hypothetical protein
LKIVLETISLEELRKTAELRFGVFDSMINLRPSQGNRTRGVDNPETRQRIVQIVKQRVKR